MKVGFIGVGNIGRPMAERLTSLPLELAVFDVSADARNAFEGRAVVASTPADVGRHAALVGICVRHDQDVIDVVTGADGLLTTLPPGAIIAVHSTVRPTTIHRLADQAAAQRVDLIDAGVSGGPMGAAKGELVCMVGGTDEQVERVRPMISAFSNKIIHAGALGTGMTLKLANNLVTYMQLMAGYEGVKLAKAGGLSPTLLREVMQGNGNLTISMGQFLAFLETGPGQLGPERFKAAQKATLGLAEKDLDFALGFAAEVGLDLPGTAGTRTNIHTVFGGDQ